MRPRFRNLPLFLKILVPFMTLMVIVGAFGAFLLVRTLSARAQDTIDQDLARRSLEARSTLRDRELSLLESATLAANLEGMAGALAAGDQRAARRLVESVLALKDDLSMLVVTGRSGDALAGFTRSGKGLRPFRDRGSDEVDVIMRALDGSPGKHADVVRYRGEAVLLIAAPVCRAGPECSPAGAALVGMRLADAATAANVTPEGERASLAIYDGSGSLLTSAGSIQSAPAAPARAADAPVRVSGRLAGEEVATFYVPYLVQGRSVGFLAVSVPTGPALSSVRDAAVRLGLILLAAMAGVVGLGALVSRRILAQVRPLVDANRALGAGELSARVIVVGDDELGELARGVNKMAEQLQASYETLEARVAERTEEVQRLLQERTEFFASISHELRTPLAVIIAQAELMRDSTHVKTPAWTIDTGATIGDSASQLLSLVNDILDLARAEAGGLVVTLQDVDLVEVVRDIRPTVEGLARAGEIDVTFDIPTTLPVIADPVRLRAILLNLADNSVKYTPPRGSITMTAARRGDDMVEVSVADTGIGIPPEIGERIFEPFFRVAGSVTQGGQASSGLGLALARRLVEAHGGTISYSSETDGGTIFTFVLPAGSRRAARGSAAGRGRSKG